MDIDFAVICNDLLQSKLCKAISSAVVERESKLKQRRSGKMLILLGVGVLLCCMKRRIDSVVRAASFFEDERDTDVASNAQSANVGVGSRSGAVDRQDGSIEMNVLYLLCSTYVLH